MPITFFKKLLKRRHTGWKARKYLFKRSEVTRELGEFHTFEALDATTTLPTLVDLRPKCPPVYDQGQLGSCTANALAAAFQFDEMKQKINYQFQPSRLFIYYNERALEGSVSTDAGASLDDGVKSLSTTGVCPETQWPYNISKFAVKPSVACYTDAKLHTCTSYKPISGTLQQLKQGLANGYPIVFGILVYESFESATVASTGVVPMPGPNEQCLGGHAIMLVGYDDSKQRFIVRNSWGTSWGVKGYFYLPYAYVTNPNLSSDFWSLITVTKD